MTLVRCRKCDEWFAPHESCWCGEVRAGSRPGAPRTGRRMVYLAGPISKGDLAHNINQATAAFAELARAGFAPLAPQWSAYSTGAKVTPGGSVYALASAVGCGLSHADWLAVDLAFVERSDAVLRLPGESTGADMETAHARASGVPVFDSVAAVIAWASA